MVTKLLDRICGGSEKKEKVVKKTEEVSPFNGLERPSLAYQDDYELEIVWKNVLIFIYLHCAAIYSWHFQKQPISVIIAWATGFMMAFGTTVGAHRLYTHRSFKANKKLQYILMYLQTMAMQNSMYEWVRDHRVHHKFVDTNADPHNSRRGFFFSHIGWLMCKKHPDVRKFGAKVDMSDLEADPLVMFQHKYYLPLTILIGTVLPVSLALYFGEYMKVAWHGHIFRYLVGLHLVWMINSAAHCFGNKPYDKSISSTDSLLVGTFGVGEGWHNYHHVFPFDYRAAELPTYASNLSLMFVDFFAWIGWATDLKTVSDEIIKKRAERTGDGTHNKSAKGKVDDNNNEDPHTDEHEHEGHSGLWGWGDKEMTEAEKKNVTILYKFYD